MIRVFVADDHAVVRDGLARILEAVDDMELAGTAGTAAEALAAMATRDWDVLVLDLSGLGPRGGIEVIEQARADDDDLKVVVYSMYPEEQFGPRMLRAGAMAYLSKGRPTERLLEAIRRAAAGVRTITEEVASRLIDVPTTELSNRELQVLHLLVEGHQTTAIAHELHISPSTVSTHIKHIKEKLGANSVTEIVAHAFRGGLAQ